jgi:hypothetical protein
MNVAEVLNKAADLIEPEGKWTQGEMAKGKTGSKVLPNSPLAVCFCAVGAIRRVARLPIYYDALNVLAKKTGPFIGRWNDAPKRTQAEVVATLREAAKEWESSK